MPRPRRLAEEAGVRINQPHPPPPQLHLAAHLTSGFAGIGEACVDDRGPGQVRRGRTGVPPGTHRPRVDPRRPAPRYPQARPQIGVCFRNITAPVLMTSRTARHRTLVSKRLASSLVCPALVRAQRPGCWRMRDGRVVQLLVNVDENGVVLNLACVNRDRAAGKHTDGLAGGQVVA